MPEQQARIDQAFEMYQRRDKTKPLRVEVLVTRKRRKANSNQPHHQLSHCPKCEQEVWVVGTDHGPRRFDPGTDQKHVCYQNRFLGGAFEGNRRKH
jgi:hypothetical protein